MKTIYLIVIISLFSACNYFSAENTQKRVDDATREVEKQIVIDKAKDKIALNKRYQKALKSTNNVLVISKLNNYYFVLTATLNYIDSLRIEMNKLDTSDLKNDKMVKKMFIDNGIGDTVLRKITKIYNLAESVTLSNKRRLEILKSRNNIFNEPSTDQIKSEYFGLSSPGGISYTLYGFEYELSKIGIESLSDY